MNAPTSSLTLPSPPRGLSFELSDLIMVLGWSEFHDLRMVVELDNYIGGEKYEKFSHSIRPIQSSPLVDVALK